MRTWDVSKAAETIAAIIRQRSADADVTVPLRLGDVVATWKRAGLPEVGLRVCFVVCDDDLGREAHVEPMFGAKSSWSAAGAVAFGRLVSDVAAIACEIEALTAGCTFVTEGEKR